jgi:tRNA/tmRNA/rRNA uracil-C5-methylase (TrmA/RlmC/RlmD family)
MLLVFTFPACSIRVLDIETCYLQPEPTNAIRNGLKEFAKAKGYSFYNIRKFEGDLRNIIVRNAGDDLMVIMVFGLIIMIIHRHYAVICQKHSLYNILVLCYKFKA